LPKQISERWSMKEALADRFNLEQRH